MVGRSREQGTDGMVTERIVVSQRIFRLPRIAAVGTFRQGVREVRLTYLIAFRTEYFVVVVLQVVSKTAYELQARHNVSDFKAGSRPDIAGAVEDIVCLKQADRIDSIPVNIGKVGTVFFDVSRVLCSGTSVRAVQRIVYGRT